MDSFEQVLRAVLNDPAQMQELKTLADSLGLSPAAPPDEATAASMLPAPSHPPAAPVPNPAEALLRQAGHVDKKQEALLLALRPFLRKERQEKLDRALHVARLASLAGLALKNRAQSPGAKESL